MARPQRNNVDYFPFLCEEGEKMFYLEETYGNDGFATFIKILRELAKVDFHYLNLSKPSSMMFLSAKCKISKEVLESIVSDLVMLEKFDKNLWDENKIIWCQDFVDSIQDAYSKRKNECIDYKGLLTLLISLGIRKPLKKTRKPNKQPSTVVENTQSIVYNTKLNDSIENEIIVNANIPSLDEFILHIESKYKELKKDFEPYRFAATNKYETWKSDGWKDGHKKPIKNWKLKANTAIQYFKPIYNAKSNTPKSRDEINRETNDAREREIVDKLRGQDTGSSEEVGSKSSETGYQEYSDWTDVP